MKLNIPFLVLAHFTIVGAQYDATGSAILDCAENWKCTVTGKTTSACNVESDVVFVNEFGYRGEGREEDDPDPLCYDSEYSGGVYVTDSKEFSSCVCPAEHCKPAGKIMLKGDDCNVKCDNCSLLFRLVPPGDDEEEEKEKYDATGSAILDCAENWNCTVTGKTTSACNVESDDLVFVNEFGYRGEGREEDGPCYDSKLSGGVYVTDSKEFSSCVCAAEYCKPAGKIMLKGDDCNVKCDSCSLLFRLVPPGDDEEEEKEITNAPSEKKEKEGTTTAPTPKEKEITNAAPSAGGLVMMATMQGVVGALLLTA